MAHEALLDRLVSVHGASIVTVVAPPGYGKTTLLSQWADRSERAAFVRLSAVDDDPAVLIRDIADGIETIASIPDEVSRSLIEPALDPGLQAAARLADAIAGPGEPSVLMLDDAHTLSDRRASDALTMLADRLPDWLTLALSGRQVDVLPLARLRTGGNLIEVGPEDLVFDAPQARELARQRGLDLTPAEAVRLVSETEGWPVAIYLTMLAIADADAKGRDRRNVDATHPIGEYIDAELVAPIDDERRSWLLRSSVLDTMTGPLCDAALEQSGSLSRLREAERSNLLVGAVDRRRTTYRYHHLLRDHLRDELHAADPDAAQIIAARAARWHAEQGDVMEAVEYAHDSGDRALSALLITRSFFPVAWSGRIATMERWVSGFDVDGLRERFASLAVVTGFIFALDGRRHEADIWLAAAEHSDDPGPMPDGTPEAAPWVATLRGAMMPTGLAGLRADVRIAVEGLRPDSPLMANARMLATAQSVLEGSTGEATRRARDAWELAEARGAMPGFAVAIAEEVAMTMPDGSARRIEELLRHGLERVRASGIEDYVTSGLLHALAARAAIVRGSVDEARAHIGRVNRIRPRLTAALPWFAVQVRLETMRACLALADVASARTLLMEVEDILRVRPDIGVLVTEAADLRNTLEASSDAGGGLWTLTSAELRVLSFLPTHLTFREIADRLFVSQHTVKTQAVAIYSKLGVSSRRAAIETAVEHGLLDPSALRFPVGAQAATGIG